jgi:hypothetical protein
MGKLLGCQLAQLIVQQGQELVGGVRVAAVNGIQDLSHIAHED